LRRSHTAPGNPGTAALGPTHTLDPTDPGAVVALAQREGVDLVVVGPEAPLVAGVVDALQAAGSPRSGRPPPRARIEGSKAFAKEVMAAAGAPTGRVRWPPATPTEAWRPSTASARRTSSRPTGWPRARACGSAPTSPRLEEAIDDALVRGVFGDAGRRVVIEEYLDGPERSLFGCATAPTVLLEPAQDYKRALDGDEGLNTGGMGAYSPVPAFDARRDVAGLRDRVPAGAATSSPPRHAVPGLLYAGLVETPTARSCSSSTPASATPRPRSILPRSTATSATCSGRRPSARSETAPSTWHDDAVVTVVLASGGYPDSVPDRCPDRGGRTGQSQTPASTVFHAGTRVTTRAGCVTAGGRVLGGDGARDSDVAEARQRAYEAADRDQLGWRPPAQRTSPPAAASSRPSATPLRWWCGPPSSRSSRWWR
jgi:phosphoribosylamine---glycine ligase